MYNVVGIEKVNYTNKAGRKVIGTALHCLCEEPKYGGYAVERIYCSSSVDCSNVSVNSNIDVLYNKYGSVSRVDVIS